MKERKDAEWKQGSQTNYGVNIGENQTEEEILGVIVDQKTPQKASIESRPTVFGK